jgi:TolA-binding protein
MWIRRLAGRSSAALILAALASFASSARAQNPQSTPDSLESEITERRAECGVIQEQLRKLEEQQKTILWLMDELQRKLDRRPAAIAQQSPPAPQPEPTPAAQAAALPKPAAPATQPAAERNITAEDAYEDGIVLVKPPEKRQDSHSAGVLGRYSGPIYQLAAWKQ